MRKLTGMAGLTKLPQWRATSARIWKYYGILSTNGLDPEEIRGDLLVHLFEQTPNYDAARACFNTYMWVIAERYIWRRLEMQASRYKKMARFRIERRTMPAFRPSEEAAEHVRMLMAGLPLRRRQMVSHYVAGWTLEQMGKRHGVTRERCRQILNKGLRAMRIRAMEIAHEAGVSADEYWSDLLCPR